MVEHPLAGAKVYPWGSPCCRRLSSVLSRARRSVRRSPPAVEGALTGAKVYPWEPPGCRARPRGRESILGGPPAVAGCRACSRGREGLTFGTPAVERALTGAKVYPWEPPRCRARPRGREGLSLGCRRLSSMLSRTRRSILRNPPAVERALAGAKVYPSEPPVCRARPRGLARLSQPVERGLASAKVYPSEPPGCRARPHRREGLSLGAPRVSSAPSRTRRSILGSPRRRLSQAVERALADAKVYPSEPPGCRARSRRCPSALKFPTRHTTHTGKRHRLRPRSCRTPFHPRLDFRAKVSFSLHSAYLTAYNYVTRPSSKKPLSKLDPEPLYSTSHPSRDEIEKSTKWSLMKSWEAHDPS